jgi:hypothetical protein
MRQLFEVKNKLYFVLKRTHVPFLGSRCAMHDTSRVLATTALVRLLVFFTISQVKPNITSGFKKLIVSLVVLKALLWNSCS